MITTSTVGMVFDDKDCTIGTAADSENGDGADRRATGWRPTNF